MFTGGAQKSHFLYVKKVCALLTISRVAKVGSDSVCSKGMCEIQRWYWILSAAAGLEKQDKTATIMESTNRLVSTSYNYSAPISVMTPSAATLAYVL